ncbi:MAG: molybdenum cofactor guanylyltransferase, partial [Burkholderiaceae bacterium]
MKTTDPDAPDPGWLSIQYARRAMLESVSPVSDWESVALREALGRVLHRDVIAPLDVPAHDNCAMDGYALRAADVAASGRT